MKRTIVAFLAALTLAGGVAVAQQPGPLTSQVQRALSFIPARMRFTGNAPTITGAFGTSNTIVGTDSGFDVNVGTSPATSGTVTFSGVWANAPMCMGTMKSNAAADQRTLGIVTTTTTAAVSFTVTSTLTAPTASTTVAVACFGR